MRFLQTDGGRQFSKRPEQVNDCTVHALANVCYVAYDVAYRAMAQGGRRSNRAAHFPPGAAGSGESREALGFAFVFSDNPHRLSIQKFAAANPIGRFVLEQYDHVLALVNGVVFDSDPERIHKPLTGWWTVTKIRG